MGENGGLTLLVGVVVVAIVLQCAGAQTVHVVGGNMGWTIPQGGAQAYVTWASAPTFNVGNTLTFNFTTGVHDVLEVQKASFDACTSTNAIGAIITNGPANFTLNTTGEHYYICTFGNGQHCQNGQKLAINVSASTSAPTPSGSPTNTSPPPPATTTTPPPPASSSSAVFASFSVTLLPIAMGFFL